MSAPAPGGGWNGWAVKILVLVIAALLLTGINFGFTLAQGFSEMSAEVRGLSAAMNEVKERLIYLERTGPE